VIDPEGWRSRGKVRMRVPQHGQWQVQIDGITTQAKYYKPLVYEAFRQEGMKRPMWGDFSVHILMEHVGSAPHLDLDNLAKALLDALKGFVFHDDSQIARLLVERAPGPRDQITILAQVIAAPP
jgi:Holliday junction resolvase RusA-like endonuclease